MFFQTYKEHYTFHAALLQCSMLNALKGWNNSGISKILKHVLKQLLNIGSIPNF